MTKFSRIASAILALAFLTMSGATWAESAQKFPTITLSAGMHLITAEVAETEVNRQQGMMLRQTMGQNEGMVFLFHRPAKVCMWMKNTFIPLSAAFIDSDGVILNIEDMEPHSLKSHCSNGLASYVLEVNQGWFQRRNVAKGNKISGLPPKNIEKPTK